MTDVVSSDSEVAGDDSGYDADFEKEFLSFKSNVISNQYGSLLDSGFTPDEYREEFIRPIKLFCCEE